MSDELVHLGRLRAGAARGERDRVVHIFPGKPAAAGEQVRSLCGEWFSAEDVDVLDAIGGMPCDRCLVSQARRAHLAPRHEPLDPPPEGRVQVRLSPSRLPQRRRGAVWRAPRELPHPIPAPAARAAAATADLEPDDLAVLSARVLARMKALPDRRTAIPEPRTVEVPWRCLPRRGA